MNFTTLPHPQIPRTLMHTMYQLKSGGQYDQQAGGQWAPAKEERIAFQGVVLPVSDKDLQRTPTGTYSKDSEKIYTNGYALTVGGSVYDPQSDMTYTVTQELGHNSIHPMKRYIVEAKGRGGSRRA